jgi:DNA-nicking Smr family endonuclease
MAKRRLIKNSPRKSQRLPEPHVVSDEEASLFREALRDIKPLQHDQIDPVLPMTPPQARFRQQDEQDVLAESLLAHIDETELNAGDYLHFQRQSVSRQVARKLARGGYSVQAETDLHGLTAVQARELLADFLKDCQRRGYTCVRIIHGKGRGSGPNGPVLKRKLDAWLRKLHNVLAFCSATQVDGGTGAVYVLLRKP